MAQRVFFSFQYGDVSRAMVVRNSWADLDKEAAGFLDAAEFESIKRQGEDVIKKWIDNQLNGTLVTAVLVGENTCNSRWVQYEIDKSKDIGNGLLGIDISKIRSPNTNITLRCGKIPKGYPFYLWFKEKGCNNIGGWIEKAAKVAGR